MTERKVDPSASEALATWSMAVRKAGWDLPIARSELTELEASAVELVDWLSLLLREGHEIQPLEAEILKRMVAAVRPGTEKSVTAAELVEEHADRYKNAIGESYRGNTKAEIAEQLAHELTEFCDAGYVVLQTKGPELCALLDRYKAGREGKLSADGLAVAIEQLAGNPLGSWSVTQKALSEARRRKRLRNT